MDQIRLGGKEEPRQTNPIDETLCVCLRDAFAIRENADREEE
jgi:hypothetical protein